MGGANFLALGDSYTIGEGVAEAERWPVQLARALGIAAPEILARTGWTTDELAAAMAQHTFHPPYDLVSLLIGVNNQYRGRDLANYREEFRALLERAIELAGRRPERVIVVSIPDWGATRFGRESGRDTAQIAREIDRYNAANAEISCSAQAHYVDVTTASREGARWVVDDGLHPSGAAYRRWSEAILPIARRAYCAERK
ncbi:MAG: SGNH/GDSL hydrolase family protein [Proteobacteria bacterium]|uniref:SGNH/GDSL hydrolase family protein n=1 Tax=Rudaea sp. TaxID=2136325 RepID=UPI003782D800|nr:SGNH/GDSL hydrolase family protein [Pseudomonadota bacterium]